MQKLKVVGAFVGIFIIIGLFSRVSANEVSAVATDLVNSNSVAELQAKIRVLMEQIQVLQTKLRSMQGLSTSTPPTMPGIGWGREIKKNICYGARNDEDVKALQERLRESGHFSGEATGNYLGLTAEAVRKYQMENGIPPVECVGPMTRAVLMKWRATSTPPDMMLKRMCPQSWIVNKMPVITEATTTLPNQYFIFDGKRRELREFDVEWIKTNCGVRPQEVF